MDVTSNHNANSTEIPRHLIQVAAVAGFSVPTPSVNVKIRCKYLKGWGFAGRGQVKPLGGQGGSCWQASNLYLSKTRTGAFSRAESSGIVTQVASELT